MKIKRYQAGGIYYTPFFRDSVVQQESQTSTKVASTENKEDDLISKEIINVLRENGLPNDINYFLSKANNFLNKSKNLGVLFDVGDNTSYDMSDLIRLQSLVSRIRHNNKLYDKASKQIINEGSGSEVAITSTGELYALDDEDKLKTITLSTYHEDPDKYTVLTNSDLIRLREEQPELAYNSTILSDLSDTVGMKSIVDYVKSTIAAFGSTKSPNQFERYISKQKGQIEKGFEQLLGFDSPDGLYKVTESTLSLDQGYDDAKSLELEAAVNYLYRTLPKNMQNVLKANAAVEGLDPNDPKDIQKLLTTAVIEHTNHYKGIKQSLDYDASASKGSSDGSSGGSEKQVKLSREEMITTGGGGVQQTPVTIASSKDRSGIEILAQPYGKPEDHSGNLIGMATIRDVFAENDKIGSSLALNSVTFGNKILSENELDYIVYDGVSNMERAFLPINQEVYANTGKITPDLDAQRRFEKFQQWLDDGYGIAPNSIAMKLRELNLDLVKDPKTNQWVFRNIKPFIMVNAYASDRAIDLDENSEWVDHVDPSEGSRIFDLYSKYVNYGSDIASKTKKRNNFDGWWFGIGDAGSMYKSIVFLPITDAAIATVTSNHELTSADNYVDMYNRRNVTEERQSIKTTF